MSRRWPLDSDIEFEEPIKHRRLAVEPAVFHPACGRFFASMFQQSKPSKRL
jgi:hypothetical protein